MSLQGPDMPEHLNDKEPSASADRGEHELLIRVKDKCAEAETELERRWTPALRQIAVEILGNYQWSEDCVQSTWMRFFCHVHEYDLCQPVGPLLFTICQNAALELLRKKREKSCSTDAHDRDVEDETPSPVEQTELEEKLDALHQCINSLTDHQMEVIKLYYWHKGNLTFESIGKILGCPTSTIKSRFQTALRRLHDCMLAKGFDE